jgi:hypothetical protein
MYVDLERQGYDLRGPGSEVIMSFRTLLTVGALSLIAAGCASSGVVPIGDGVYLISKKSIGCGFASAESIKADLYKEANEFCAERKKEIHTVDVIANDGIPAVRCANAELHYTCVDAPTR